MESINQTLRGLLLGVGFTAGALIIYVVYQQYVAAPARMEFRRSLIKEIERDFAQLSVEVLDYKLMKDRNVVVVASKIKNSGTHGQLDVAPKIDFFDHDKRFLFDCYGKTVPFLEGGAEVYFTTECRALDESKTNRISDVRARPVSRT